MIVDEIRRKQLRIGTALFIVASMTLVALLVAGCGNGNHGPTPQPGEAINIRFSTWHPADSRECVTVWAPMLEELEERSGGRISHTTYFGAALGRGPEHYDMVASGLSDMGYFTATWTPDRFPLTDVLSLAAWVDGKDIAADIGNAMFKRILYREFGDVKVLELNGCIQAFLWTRTPVHSLEDVKGLRIRSPGGHQTRYIRAIGAEPVFMPLGDVYSAMEAGELDGIVTCPPLFLDYGLYRVAKHGALTTFGCVSEGVLMNKARWERIPEDLRPIIEEVCSNPFRTTGALTAEVYRAMMDEIANEGVELYTLPREEAQRWFAEFQEVTRDWVAELEAMGLPAQEAVNIFNEECERRGIACVAYPPEWKE